MPWSPSARAAGVAIRARSARIVRTARRGRVGRAAWRPAPDGRRRPRRSVEPRNDDGPLAMRERHHDRADSRMADRRLRERPDVVVQLVEREKVDHTGISGGHARRPALDDDLLVGLERRNAGIRRSNGKCVVPTVTKIMVLVKCRGLSRASEVGSDDERMRSHGRERTRPTGAAGLARGVERWSPAPTRSPLLRAPAIFAWRWVDVRHARCASSALRPRRRLRTSSDESQHAQPRPQHLPRAAGRAADATARS